ncbi:Gfo/Idh/MocA family oxidoreductase [Natronolimnobius sp. AArcel1]|uniref:Gfo/Idh/MocA family protein n=1 Tax=Natronolimnobius sp. AArcel1 TaxID=1679093 RepID=UPI0013EA9414|nr:Gfo/Idh/MocA family oxidoreductase [Natronolimnobius sp. AArcel1]NGM69666.1 Gfo/Idh/MocA family oxidoreductase [Natronolimnobius sp. AArcel1]
MASNREPDHDETESNTNEVATGSTITDITSVRTGLVGLGNIGHHHADRLADLGVPVVGGMDVASDAREEFANRYDTAVYDDHRDLYDAVDAVIITTPNKFHEQYAVDAFERDLHVLLEKPIAHSLESAKRVAAAAADSEGVCTVGFNNRFLNAVRLVRERIARGEFGEVTHVEANYVRRRGVPGRGSWFTRRDISGGGALIDLGVHAIDLAMYLLDYPDTEAVTGVTRSEFGSREDYVYLDMWGDDQGADAFDVDDSASAFVRCAGDRTISLEVAWATNRPPTHEFVVRGTDAAATFDLLTNELSIHSASAEGIDHMTDTSIKTSENDSHVDEQKAFFESIVGGRCDGSSIEEALAVQRIVDGIYRSSETGATISFAEKQAEITPEV